MIASTPSQTIISTWQPATWETYEQYRDSLPDWGRHRIYYHNGYLKADDMGWEGIRHAEVRELFIMIFAFWFAQHPDQTAKSLGGCLMEKEGYQAAAADLVLYLGEGAPSWATGEKRRINLNECRIPDLVGEVADTSLADDLKPMKALYATLGIPEYWIIDAKAYKIFAFQLQPNGTYQPIETSNILSGLPIRLLQQTLDRLIQDTNISAAQWFMQAISSTQ